MTAIPAHWFVQKETQKYICCFPYRWIHVTCFSVFRARSSGISTRRRRYDTHK